MANPRGSGKKPPVTSNSEANSRLERVRQQREKELADIAAKQSKIRAKFEANRHAQQIEAENQRKAKQAASAQKIESTLAKGKSLSDEATAKAREEQRQKEETRARLQREKIAAEFKSHHNVKEASKAYEQKVAETRYQNTAETAIKRDILPHIADFIIDNKLLHDSKIGRVELKKQLVDDLTNSLIPLAIIIQKEAAKNLPEEKVSGEMSGTLNDALELMLDLNKKEFASSRTATMLRNAGLSKEDISLFTRSINTEISNINHVVQHIQSVFARVNSNIASRTSEKIQHQAEISKLEEAIEEHLKDVKTASNAPSQKQITALLSRTTVLLDELQKDVALLHNQALLNSLMTAQVTLTNLNKAIFEAKSETAIEREADNVVGDIDRFLVEELGGPQSVVTTSKIQDTIDNPDSLLEGLEGTTTASSTIASVQTVAETPTEAPESKAENETTTQGPGVDATTADDKENEYADDFEPETKDEKPEAKDEKIAVAPVTVTDNDNEYDNDEFVTEFGDDTINDTTQKSDNVNVSGVADTKGEDEILEDIVVDSQDEDVIYTPGPGIDATTADTKKDQAEQDENEYDDEFEPETKDEKIAVAPVVAPVTDNDNEYDNDEFVTEFGDDTINDTTQKSDNVNEEKATDEKETASEKVGDKPKDNQADVSGIADTKGEAEIPEDIVTASEDDDESVIHTQGLGLNAATTTNKKTEDQAEDEDEDEFNDDDLFDENDFDDDNAGVADKKEDEAVIPEDIATASQDEPVTAQQNDQEEPERVVEDPEAEFRASLANSLQQSVVIAQANTSINMAKVLYKKLQQIHQEAVTAAKAGDYSGASDKFWSIIKHANLTAAQYQKARADYAKVKVNDEKIDTALEGEQKASGITASQANHFSRFYAEIAKNKPAYDNITLYKNRLAAVPNELTEANLQEKITVSQMLLSTYQELYKAETAALAHLTKTTDQPHYNDIITRYNTLGSNITALEADIRRLQTNFASLQKVNSEEKTMNTGRDDKDNEEKDLNAATNPATGKDAETTAANEDERNGIFNFDADTRRRPLDNNNNPPDNNNDDAVSQLGDDNENDDDLGVPHVNFFGLDNDNADAPPLTGDNDQPVNVNYVGLDDNDDDAANQFLGNNNQAGNVNQFRNPNANNVNLDENNIILHDANLANNKKNVATPAAGANNPGKSLDQLVEQLNKALEAARKELKDLDGDYSDVKSTSRAYELASKLCDEIIATATDNPKLSQERINNYLTSASICKNMADAMTNALTASNLIDEDDNQLDSAFKDEIAVYIKSAKSNVRDAYDLAEDSDMGVDSVMISYADEDAFVSALAKPALLNVLAQADAAKELGHIKALTSHLETHKKSHANLINDNAQTRKTLYEEWDNKFKPLQDKIIARRAKLKAIVPQLEQAQLFDKDNEKSIGKKLKQVKEALTYCNSALTHLATIDNTINDTRLSEKKTVDELNREIAKLEEMRRTATKPIQVSALQNEIDDKKDDLRDAERVLNNLLDVDTIQDTIDAERDPIRKKQLEYARNDNLIELTADTIKIFKRSDYDSDAAFNEAIKKSQKDLLPDGTPPQQMQAKIGLAIPDRTYAESKLVDYATEAANISIKNLTNPAAPPTIVNLQKNSETKMFNVTVISIYDKTSVEEMRQLAMKLVEAYVNQHPGKRIYISGANEKLKEEMRAYCDAMKDLVKDPIESKKYERYPEDISLKQKISHKFNVSSMKSYIEKAAPNLVHGKNVYSHKRGFSIFGEQHENRKDDPYQAPKSADTVQKVSSKIEAGNAEVEETRTSFKPK